MPPQSSAGERYDRDIDPITVYLNEIGRYELLTAEEEVALAKSIEAGEQASQRLSQPEGSLDDDEQQELEAAVVEGLIDKSKFINSNLRLVVAIAKKYNNRGLDFLDLIQDGNIGLMRAVEKFDYRRGFKFSTYASWWIRQFIARGLADKKRTIRIPVHASDNIDKINSAMNTFKIQTGREPSNEELSELTQLSVDNIEFSLGLVSTISMQEPWGDNLILEDTLTDKEADDKPVEEAVLSRSLDDELMKLLSSLGPREQEVLILRYGLNGGKPKTLDYLGKKFNVTRERVRQIEKKALSKMRTNAKDGGLEDVS